MQRVKTLICSVGILFGSHCMADNALLLHKEVKQFVHQMVSKDHFDNKQIRAILQQAVYQPQIIDSMERPYEKKTWDVYKDLFLTSQRLNGGLEFWRANQDALREAEKKFGVPASVIVAILGVETLYGAQQGNYRVLDALTTLAFYYPKRAPFFTKELREYLLLCRERGVSATEYKGSYAGAMGKPQFMPSSYRYYAVNLSGSKQSDLIHNNQDAIASVANYLHHHGWVFNQGVAQPAVMTGVSYKELITNSRSPDYNLNQLLAFGIKPANSLLEKPPIKAGLIQLETKQGEEYWLAYPNFYVITRYNTSPQYALVVYLLSQSLNQQWSHNAVYG